MNHSQICSRCVMDTTDTNISFNQEGICNHCIEYDALAPLYLYKGKETDLKLQALVDLIKEKGKNSEYDCICGVSGGVDSSYVAYNAKKLGLRTLLVHFDNGWNSEQAVKNIENIAKYTGFDYQTHVVDWEEFKDLQLAFLKASVANAEIPTDHAFLAAIYKLAKNYNIKYILSGSNFATEAILPDSWGYNAKDLKQLKAIHKKFGHRKLVTYPLLGIQKELYYTYVCGIKMVRLLNYLPYIKTDAMKVIETEMGWKYYGGKHYESVFTRFFQSYILPVKFNIDKRKAHLSTLICSKQLTREEALKELESPPYSIDKLEDDIDYVTKKLGLNRAEFDAIMKAPVKLYSDYPNQEKVLKIIYSVYHFFKRK